MRFRRRPAGSRRTSSARRPLSWTTLRAADAQAIYHARRLDAEGKPAPDPAASDEKSDTDYDENYPDYNRDELQQEEDKRDQGPAQKEENHYARDYQQRPDELDTSHDSS